MMTLDEAITHCQEKSCGDTECSREHKQLGEWLVELKQRREQEESVSEDLEKFAEEWDESLYRSNAIKAGAKWQKQQDVRLMIISVPQKK